MYGNLSMQIPIANSRIATTQLVLYVVIYPNGPCNAVVVCYFAICYQL